MRDRWGGDEVEVRERFRATAADVDAGARDVREGLRWLGRRGLLTPHPDGATRLGHTVRLLRVLAAASLADAFAAWSQTMVVDYLTRFLPGAEHTDVVTGLVDGTVPGATALAPAITDVAGGPPVPVLAEPRAAGWSLTGPVRWASNLFPGAVLVVPAHTPNGGRLVAPLRLDAPGVRVGPTTALLALDATGTSSVALHGARVTSEAVLTCDLAGFLHLCRPTMIVTQAALALGLADAALQATEEALTGPSDGLRTEHEDLGARRDAVSDRLSEAAAGPGDASAPAAGARLDAMAVATRAVTLEGIAHGGSGFRRDSATSRRRREVAFLPLQAPTVPQLRAAVAAARRRLL